tara:strand:+ start:5251 stop:5871 length:621 start_codon:yes stop_codon:yes gene_type:complete
MNKMIDVILNYVFGSLKSVIFRKRLVKKILRLKYHSMFRVIENTRTRIKYTKFYNYKKFDSTKSQMFVDFMNFKLDTIADEFQKLIVEASEAVDNDMLKDLVHDTMARAVKVYVEKTRIHFIKNGVPYDDADEIIRLFEKWREETISIISNEVSIIFASNYHESKYENLLAVLGAISIAIAFIPKDGIAAFNAINGKFMEIKYKNR